MCAQANVNKRNIDTIVAELNENRKTISELRTALGTANGNIAMLHSEITNTKQLIAHTMGRGMGSSVHP